MTLLESQVSSALFERTQRGSAVSLQGTVRLTASEIVSAYLLPDALCALRRSHPGIQIELVASNTVENLLDRDADIAGFDRSDQRLRGFRAAGFDVTSEFFAFRCDNQIVAWRAVLAGMGIGVGLQAVASLSGDLVQVLREVTLPHLPLWITAHRELRGTPRLKVVFDALAAALATP